MEVPKGWKMVALKKNSNLNLAKRGVKCAKMKLSVKLLEEAGDIRVVVRQWGDENEADVLELRKQHRKDGCPRSGREAADEKQRQAGAQKTA